MTAGPARWLTLAEAAERVGRDERTIRRWVEREELAPMMGRFREADLIATEKRMRSRVGRPRGRTKPPD